MGLAVTSAGDLDRDGFADVLVGTAGYGYAFSGERTGVKTSPFLITPRAAYTIAGAGP